MVGPFCLDSVGSFKTAPIEQNVAKFLPWHERAGYVVSPKSCGNATGGSIASIPAVQCPHLPKRRKKVSAFTELMVMFELFAYISLFAILFRRIASFSGLNSRWHEEPNRSSLGRNHRLKLLTSSNNSHTHNTLYTTRYNKPLTPLQWTLSSHTSCGFPDSLVIWHVLPWNTFQLPQIPLQN